MSHTKGLAEVKELPCSKARSGEGGGVRADSRTPHDCPKVSKKKCEICGQRPATVPDRERQGRPVNRICSECHRSRLAEDMKIVMAAAAKQAMSC